MKIKVTFRKLLEGGVNAFIEVTDAGDLPTANIFKDIKDYPSKKEYHLTHLPQFKNQNLVKSIS